MPGRPLLSNGEPEVVNSSRMYIEYSPVPQALLHSQRPSKTTMKNKNFSRHRSSWITGSVLMLGKDSEPEDAAAIFNRHLVFVFQLLLHNCPSGGHAVRSRVERDKLWGEGGVWRALHTSLTYNM